jgi:hypothetical protein
MSAIHAYYTSLIAGGASSESAKRKAARQYHPDKGGDSKAFQEFMQAFVSTVSSEKLKDEEYFEHIRLEDEKRRLLYEKREKQMREEDERFRLQNAERKEQRRAARRAADKKRRQKLVANEAPLSSGLYETVAENVVGATEDTVNVVDDTEAVPPLSSGLYETVAENVVGATEDTVNVVDDTETVPPVVMETVKETLCDTMQLGGGVEEGEFICTLCEGRRVFVYTPTLSCSDCHNTYDFVGLDGKKRRKKLIGKKLAEKKVAGKVIDKKKRTRDYSSKGTFCDSIWERILPEILPPCRKSIRDYILAAQRCTSGKEKNFPTIHTVDELLNVCVTLTESSNGIIQSKQFKRIKKVVNGVTAYVKRVGFAAARDYFEDVAPIHAVPFA